MFSAKLLTIDLTNQTSAVDDIPEKIIHNYIGGRGLGAYLLCKLVPPKIDPLDRQNHLIFTAGPASGTDLFYGNKAVVTTKSPLTNIYLYSLCSGIIGHQIRKAGFMAIDIKGKSEKPVYLVINNQSVEFKDASALWGLKTTETQQGILGNLPAKETATLSIGPAGEKLVKYAAIMAGFPHTRTFGRGGPGCVMGSKLLKGIVIKGTGQVTVGDPAKFESVKKVISERVKKNREWTKLWRLYGTAGDMEWFNQQAILPTRNWQSGQFEGWRGIDPASIAQEWPRQHFSCGPYCASPCAQYIEISKGPYSGTKSGGPEYETVYAFGSNCGINKFDAISAANQFCNEYGIDTMTAGASVGFAMECFEKGLIGLKDTDGIDLRFGNDQALIQALQKIANREGIGNLLAEGVRSFSQKLPGSEKFAMQAKGMEFGGYECRGLMGQALAMAVGNRGGCHHAMGLIGIPEVQEGTRMQISGKGEQVKEAAIGRNIRDSIPICTFPSFLLALAGQEFVGKLIDNEMLSEIVASLFGEPWAYDDIRKTGIRIICQERLFNMREGVTRINDILPSRLLNEPKPSGPPKGATVPLEALKDEYYRAMGWDLKTGNPTDSLLDELEIER
ncbi:MAG: aldehyde ferredoxin oxidoreductase family protein [Deltaproteobacteria bacterium]|nr:aldehyde ferredoxin oxidoreductase family protein [Deltaproteobacteria bacterium]